MLKDAQLPNEFWPDALQTGVYLRNRTPSGPEVDGEVVTPEEAYTGLRPSIDHVRTWGCKMYSHVSSSSLPDKQDKLMDRGRVGVLLGYVEGTAKQYWMWAPDMKKAIKVSSGSVRFNENEKLEIKELGIVIQTKPNTVPVRNPVGRPPKPAVQRRVFSHVEIPVERPTAGPLDHGQRDQKEEGTASNTETASEENLSNQQPEIEQHGQKRARDQDEEDPDEPQSKILRALQAISREPLWPDKDEDSEPVRKVVRLG